MAPLLTYDAHTEEPESEESIQCKRVEGTTSKRNKAVQKQKLQGEKKKNKPKNPWNQWD